MLGVGAGTFRNESALAVGYSRASDNGKLLFKVGGTASSRVILVQVRVLGYVGAN